MNFFYFLDSHFRGKDTPNRVWLSQTGYATWGEAGCAMRLKWYINRSFPQLDFCHFGVPGIGAMA